MRAQVLDFRSQPMAAPTSFSATAYARVGLVGNPSDGFHGKTIAVAVENF